jgi:hypothetical protein
MLFTVSRFHHKRTLHLIAKNFFMICRILRNFPFYFAESTTGGPDLHQVAGTATKSAKSASIVQVCRGADTGQTSIGGPDPVNIYIGQCVLEVYKGGGGGLEKFYLFQHGSIMK